MPKDYLHKFAKIHRRFFCSLSFNSIFRRIRQVLPNTGYVNIPLIRDGEIASGFPQCKRSRLPSRPEDSHRDSHRSGLDTLASSGSYHRTKAAAFRCNVRLLPVWPGWPNSTAMTHPLRSTGITPLHHYYGAVRPSPAHRYFRPRGCSRLGLFPWHRRPGSHVPYKSLIELRAAYMPDVAGQASGFPQLIPEEVPAPGSDII